MKNRNVANLQSLINYCQDILNMQLMYGLTYEKFIENKGYQYAISFCLEQIGELAKKLRDNGIAEKYSDISWNEIAGLRNRIAHGYDKIDLEMVFDISTAEIEELMQKCEEILKKEERS